jgi:hypothetical protein
MEASSKLAHSCVVKNSTAGNTIYSQRKRLRAPRLPTALSGYCPECLATNKTKRYDFEDLATGDSGSPRYRCEECGILIESQEPTPPALHPSSWRAFMQTIVTTVHRHGLRISLRVGGVCFPLRSEHSGIRATWISSG